MFNICKALYLACGMDYLVHTVVLWDSYYYYPHLNDKETEAQRV